tara:strand:+ start:278 stop:619 length:342 start_codon:yes stop_codon:yes gene_type:complete
MLSLEPPVFVVDVSNVSYHQTFVKKKVEKSLLFRFGLEFFDFVSPMVLATLSLDAVGSCKEPFDLDKRFYTAISGGALAAVRVFVSDADYHTELGTSGHHILVLVYARCGQGY